MVNECWQLADYSEHVSFTQTFYFLFIRFRHIWSGIYPACDLVLLRHLRLDAKKNDLLGMLSINLISELHLSEHLCIYIFTIKLCLVSPEHCSTESLTLIYDELCSCLFSDFFINQFVYIIWTTNKLPLLNQSEIQILF